FKESTPEKLTANLYDQSGRKERVFSIEKNTTQVTLNLRNLPPGLYSLTLVNSAGIVQAEKQLVIAGN
ncbi:MAG: T9SS type A sorting domain-containing protein, partial [Saprospiraceae bacterium]